MNIMAAVTMVNIIMGITVNIIMGITMDITTDITMDIIMVVDIGDILAGRQQELG
jgi:hypothetical protein